MSYNNIDLRVKDKDFRRLSLKLLLTSVYFINSSKMSVRIFSFEMKSRGLLITSLYLILSHTYLLMMAVLCMVSLVSNQPFQSPFQNLKLVVMDFGACLAQR